MRRSLTAVVLVMSASLTAKANEIGRDTTSALSHNWNGFYLGGHLGGGWGDQDATILPDIFILPARSTIPQNQSGFVYGAQGGFNYQVGTWVVGIEGAFSGTGIDGTGQRPSLIPDFVVHTAGDINWLASMVGRLGYAQDRSLFYVKAGVAQLDFDFEGYSTFEGEYQGGGRIDDRLTGWTLGAGIEYALTSAWSTRLEYNYFDFGSENYTVGGTPIQLNMELHTVQLGLNYRF